MSVPTYAEYKDSGLDLIGQVPTHWNVIQAGRIGRFTASGIDKKFKDGEAIVRLLNYLNVYNSVDKIIDESTGFSITSASDDKIVEHSLRRGDVCFTPSSETANDIGNSAVAMTDLPDVVYSYHLIRFRPEKLIDTSFSRFVFNAQPIVRQLSLACKGTTRQILTRDDFQTLLIPIPPFAEQSAIAAFLDRETAKIDALVAEQRRLIELLKEKRQAVISHAVTKGLNPDAPTKPSGIPWLGDVPAHWEVRKLSHFFRAQKGKHGQMLTREFLGEFPGVYPVYSGQTENDGIMGHWSEYEFDYGNNGVLFSTTVGAKAMNLAHLFGRFSLSQNCMIISSVTDQCETRFYYYHLWPLFTYERGLIPEHMQASFRIDDLYSYRIAVPPSAEQRVIAEFLDRETAKLEALGAEAQRAITLLQERRTALISAAVTGKIDVREAVAEGVA
jgi:type I restriction enzyme S subunit